MWRDAHRANSRTHAPGGCRRFLNLPLIAALGLFACCSALAAVPAFPGAEGFGAMVTGGRGGSVYHVTNLNDSGSGSFREAVSQGHRIVVFDVGGYINLASELHIASDITIAGQTAPGDGAGIYGNSVSLSRSQNVIVRHLRFRQGLNSGAKKSALNITAASHLMLDHLSVQWGRWDTVDMGGTNDTFTCQNCIIGEGIAPQRFGCLCQVDYVTFSHNLWINNHSRNPKSKGHVQYVNNVVYNYGIGFVGGHSAANHYHDLINNYFIKGPSSGASFAGEFTGTDQVYQSGNYADLDLDGQLNGRAVIDSDFSGATTVPMPFFHPPAPVAMEDAVTAYKRIASNVGASLHRDSVDSRLIRELTSLGKLGQVISDPAAAGGPGTLQGGRTPVDTDGDGMPDYWELATGSNPAVADGNNAAPGGYTLLEEYLNWLAEPHSTTQKNSPVEIDLRDYTAGFNSNASYSVSAATNGKATLLDNAHAVRFVPAKGFIGCASFVFVVNDGSRMQMTIGVLVTPDLAAGVTP